MSEMMRGFAMFGPSKVGMDTKPKPQIEHPRDVIVKMTAVAVCTSDIHMVDDPVASAMYNGIEGHFMGHEGVGIITEVGSEVKDFKVGDRVVIGSFYPDHNCMESQMGHPEFNLPSARTVDTNLEGMFAEYARVPYADSNLAKIADNVTDEQAVIMSDMGATAISGLEYLDVQYGESVAVIGIGPVGLMGVNCAATFGAGRLYAVGSRPITLEKAAEMGATHVLNYKECDYVEEIIKMNGGPVDKVLICGGNDQTVLQACKLVRPGGRIANLAFWFYPSIPIGCIGLGNREYQAISIKAGRYFYERIMKLVENGRIKPEVEISHVFHGIEKTPEAFEVMRKSGPDVIKSIVIYD